MTSLGMMYCLGRGVPKDDIEGVKWLTIAARRGHAPAKKSLETARRRLTPDDVATAEQYADDYIRNWDEDVAAQEAEAKGLPAPERRTDTQADADPYKETLSPGSYSPESHPDEYHGDDHSGEMHAGESQPDDGHSGHEPPPPKS